MLSSQEQRVWDDVQRFWAEEVEEPPRLAAYVSSRETWASRHQTQVPLAVGAGIRITILLLLFGAAIAALTVAVATAIGWALWHNWPQLRGQDAAATSPRSGEDETTRGPADQRTGRHPN